MRRSRDARVYGSGRRRSGGAVWLAAALLAGGLAMGWTTGSASAQAGKKSKEELVQKLTGKHLRVDKATGRPRPATAREAQETVEQLERLMPESPATPQVRTAAGAVLELTSKQSGRVVLARPRTDGSYETRCVESVDEGVAFLSGELAADAANR